MHHAYDIGPPSAPARHGFTLCPVRCANSPDSNPTSSLIAKCYSGLSIVEVDELIVEAIRLVYHPPDNTWRLIDVVVEQKSGKTSEFRVVYVIEKMQDTIEAATLMKDDREVESLRNPGGYRIGELIYGSDDIGAKVFFATSPSGVPVVITKKRFATLLETNSFLHQGISQARLRHPSIAHLLDIILTIADSQFEVNLVTERLLLSLKTDLLDRARSMIAYPEEEIFQALKDVGLALLHAKGYVSDRQGIAHGGVKPANVLISDRRKFKITDFGGGTGSIDRAARTANREELCYAGTEVRSDPQSRSFPGDIFAFGMTLLHMCVLNFEKREIAALISVEEPRRSQTIEGLIHRIQYSDELKRVLRKMTTHDPKKRPTIEEVMQGFEVLQSPLLPRESLIEPVEGNSWTRLFDTDYELGALLSESPPSRLEVYISRYYRSSHFFPARSPLIESGLKKRFLAKCYTRTDIAEVDLLLKEALTQAAKQYSRRCRLVDVFVTQPDYDLKEYKVVLVLEKLEPLVEESTLKRDDSDTDHRSGMEGYVVRGLAYSNPSAGVDIEEATSTATSEPLIVKKIGMISSLSDVNPWIRAAINQSRAVHPHICRILDIALTIKYIGLELRIVMERLQSDLGSEIEEKAERGSTFSEEELIRCIREVGAALFHMKNMVLITQNLAHLDPKPANILLTADRHFKISAFESVFERRIYELSEFAYGSNPYMSPEIGEIMMGGVVGFDIFAAEVYSFGVALLHMGLGEISGSGFEGRAEQQQWAEEMVQRLRCSELLRRTVRTMLNFEPRQRPSIEAVVKAVAS